MALALDIHLPDNARTDSRSALAPLVERAAAGDAAAFEQLMIHSQQKVMALSWRILGNEADARDASQEVFLRVYKYLRRFRQDQEFVPWVYGITVNVCRDILKKRQVSASRFISFSEDAQSDHLSLRSAAVDAEQAFIRNQQRELISSAVATLPFKERAAILLRDVEGFSTDEVASILNSSSTTVRSQISTARKKIRDYCHRFLKVEQPNEL